MKSLILGSLLAWTAFAYPEVETPVGVVGIVQRTGASECVLIEAQGNPCLHNITLYLIGLKPGVYSLTVTGIHANGEEFTFTEYMMPPAGQTTTALAWTGQWAKDNEITSVTVTKLSTFSISRPRPGR